ncbi:hypothetical protein Tco_0827903 [Tanacetum coccineum]
MPPKRTSTSEASSMTQATIKKLVADSVSAALEAQAANKANTDNTTRLREALVARQCSYKEFISCQPINFKGSEGAVVLIRWFKRTELVFSRSNCTEDYKVKFATGTLTEGTLSWWNSFTQPIGGWPFVSVVLSQIAHLVACIILDSVRSYVMQSVFLTQEKVSSIPIVFSWSDRIRPEGFLSSVLLWLMIIVAVAGVCVTVVVVIIIVIVVDVGVTMPMEEPTC